MPFEYEPGWGCTQSHASRHAQTDSCKKSTSGVCLCSNTECEQLLDGKREESDGRASRHKWKPTHNQRKGSWWGLTWDRRADSKPHASYITVTKSSPSSPTSFHLHLPLIHTSAPYRVWHPPLTTCILCKATLYQDMNPSDIPDNISSKPDVHRHVRSLKNQATKGLQVVILLPLDLLLILKYVRPAGHLTLLPLL